MKRKTYPTDLSDEQWKLLESILPPLERFGRKRSIDLRAVARKLPLIETEIGISEIHQTN